MFHLGTRQEKKQKQKIQHTTNLDKVRQDSFLVPEDQRCRATQMNMVTQFREGAKAQHMAPAEGKREGSTPFEFLGRMIPVQNAASYSNVLIPCDGATSRWRIFFPA